MKQKITIAFILTIISITIFWACKEEELPVVPSNNKIELTIIEDSTSYVFSEITCNFNQLPNFTIEQHGFCWDTVASVTIEKQSNALGNLTNLTFQETIESLHPNKIYYIKGYIQNGDIIIYSNEITIQTLDARPVVSTSEVINIKGNRAECGGTASAYETLFPITQRGVCWAETQNPTISDSLTTNSTGNGIYVSEMLNLEIGTNYFARAYAINSEGLSYGNEKSFSTLDGIPELTTDSIRNITPTGAFFYGNIIENDGLEILEKGFCWNISANPTVEHNFQTVTGNTLGNFLFEANGLGVNTTYYVKAYIKNEAGTFYGDEIIFTTSDGLSSITTSTVSNITAISASCGGSITDDSGFPITARGLCWSTNQNPTITDSHTTNGNGLGSFTSSLTSLMANTTYYIRAYATNPNGTAYGNQVNFLTLDGIPTLTTTSISNITAISASSGGNISDDGGSVITERGVCWSTNQNPTIIANKTIDGASIGEFTSNLIDLAVNTTYYICAYATNSIGTIYGNEISFTTEDGLPTLTTTEISNITATSSESGGDITDNGGFAITSRGVCWSTNPNPTIADSHTTDGTGSGKFSSNITGLSEWISYYVRGYAINSNGITYGDEINFSTVGGTVTDYDGNEYKIIQVGNQIWMAENLRTTHYTDGTLINLIEDNTAWSALTETSIAYCYYDNSIINSNTYGNLYTWSAAMNAASSSNGNPSGVQGVCPEEWHMPSDSEWVELEDYLSNNGYSGIEGYALKSTYDWNSNGNGDDNWGFAVLPGGYRNADGTFSNLGLGYQADFLSTTEFSNYEAWARSFIYSNSTLRRFSNTKRYGFSVRCIKD
jgi:uncharacterized protein (TIGR02145 family)